MRDINYYFFIWGDLCCTFDKNLIFNRKIDLFPVVSVPAAETPARYFSRDIIILLKQLIISFKFELNLIFLRASNT